MTIISMLHVISFSFSWATLAVSVLSVSLYGVKTSTGVMSEHELVSAFVKADNDHSGVLDKKEVEEAVKKLGLPSAKFFKLRKKLDSLHGASITLPVWYDLVGDIYQTDGLAAYHSPIIGIMLAPFVKLERKRRKDFVLRRVQAAIDRKDVSGDTTLMLSSPGLRRRVVPADPDTKAGGDDEEAPEAPSGGGASLGANVRLEDLVTEHELSDSSEIVARRVAGYLDLGAMIALPLCYMIVVIVYFNRFGAMMAEEEFENTKVVHVAPEDF